jgi:hypothetical protein
VREKKPNLANKVTHARKSVERSERGFIRQNERNGNLAPNKNNSIIWKEIKKSDSLLSKKGDWGPIWQWFNLLLGARRLKVTCHQIE